MMSFWSPNTRKRESRVQRAGNKCDHEEGLEIPKGVIMSRTTAVGGYSGRSILRMMQETYRGLKPHFKGRCEDMKEFEASLGYMRDCLKTKQSHESCGKGRKGEDNHNFPWFSRDAVAGAEEAEDGEIQKDCDPMA